MNLILSHLIEKKFDFISLRLLSFFVSSHLMKKNPVLSHFMKIKSDSVSFHQKKILFCSDFDSEQNEIRMENPGSCDQSSCCNIIIVIMNHYYKLLLLYFEDNLSVL